MQTKFARSEILPRSGMHSASNIKSNIFNENILFNQQKNCINLTKYCKIEYNRTF